VTRRATIAARVALGAVLILVLGGPSPGSVGGCTDDPTFANAEAFCIDKNEWICQRRWARAEIDDAQRNSCLDMVPGMCLGTTWPTDCDPPPTVSQTGACIDRLRSASQVETPVSEIPECQLDFLCGGVP